MEKMDHTSTASNPVPMTHTLNGLKGSVGRASQQGIAAHEIEAGMWRRVLPYVHQSLERLFALVGAGDAGDSGGLPDGRKSRRLEDRHPRVYQSICGRFAAEQVVYGSRAGHQIASVPIGTSLPLPAERSQPSYTCLWAHLPQDQEDHMVSAPNETCGWRAQAVARRTPRADKLSLVLMDGQASLWEAGARDVPRGNMVARLDLLHAPPWIWDTAHLCERRDADHALRVGYDRVLRIGQSNGRSVGSGPRQMGRKGTLRGKTRDKLATISGSLPTNTHRMRDDASLAADSPIVSRVIEGGWRQGVKDRLERCDMRWTIRERSGDIGWAVSRPQWPVGHRYEVLHRPVQPTGLSTSSTCCRAGNARGH